MRCDLPVARGAVDIERRTSFTNRSDAEQIMNEPENHGAFRGGWGKAFEVPMDLSTDSKEPQRMKTSGDYSSESP